MVSFFVIEEDPVVGYLSLSVCSLLNLWKWQATFRSVAPTVPLGVWFRGSLHAGSMSMATAQCIAFLWLSCEGQGGPFQVWLVLVGGNRRSQLCIMALPPLFPSGPTAVCALCFDRFHYLMPKNASGIFLGDCFHDLSQESLLHFLLYYYFQWWFLHFRRLLFLAQ